MKISIVTIAFNAEATIADAVQSVVNQVGDQVSDPFELEYIVVDGASTDGTLAAIEPFRDRITTVISEPDLGLYDGMNKGVRAATGDFVGILNADDTSNNFFHHISLSDHTCYFILIINYNYRAIIFFCHLQHSVKHTSVGSTG